MIRYDPTLVDLCSMYQHESREHSGSVVECLTRDQGAAGSSLTFVTVLSH